MEHQMMTSIPMELVTEIFLRLPVKALLRFRAVCRDLCYVIDSTNFINMHLAQSIQNEMNSCLIFAGYHKSGLYSVDLKSLADTVELDVRLLWPKDIWDRFSTVMLLGSCNGLLCLSSFWKHISLWNPSTKKHLVLPPFCVKDVIRYSAMAFGFGFDSTIDDYKVVSIVEYSSCNRHIDTEVNVYSLKSNSWHRVYGFPKGLRHRGTNGVLFRESLYWPVICKWKGSYSYNSIVSFDLRTEEFDIVHTPSSTEGSISDGSFMSIQVIEGCLSASFFHMNVGFDLWIMEEYEVAGSWTKLISIHDPNMCANYQLRPIVYIKNVGMLLIGCSIGDSMKFVWHDFETKAIEKVPVRNLPRTFGNYVLLPESLVPLDGGGR